MIYLEDTKEMFLGSRLAVYAFAFRTREGWHIKKPTTFRLLVGVARYVPRCQFILDYFAHSERAGWHIKKPTNFVLLVGITRYVPRICHYHVILDYFALSE